MLGTALNFFHSGGAPILYTTEFKAQSHGPVPASVFLRG